jgi:hypothetical protein
MPAGTSQNGISPALSSDWGGLSPHLLAHLFEVKHQAAADGKSFFWVRDPNSVEVIAPITDASAEFTMLWQSDFEGAGPDQKFSSAAAMIQSGVFSQMLAELGTKFDSATFKSLADRARQYEGGSNFSRLNSMQVFNGMPPLKLPLTAHFRAMKDARREVKDPIDQLVRWSLPQELADFGPVGEAIGGRPGLFPSQAPVKLGMQYADLLLMPIVVESITVPVSGQRTRDGTLAYAAVNLQLATLTALDAKDWAIASAYSARST